MTKFLCLLGLHDFEYEESVLKFVGIAGLIVKPDLDGMVELWQTKKSKIERHMVRHIICCPCFTLVTAIQSHILSMMAVDISNIFRTISHDMKLAYVVAL